MSEMIERVAERLHRSFYAESVRGIAAPWQLVERFEKERWLIVARAGIEAMRDVDNDILAEGYEAMFDDKWTGTQAPMMGAGWEAMIDAALK